MLQHHETAGHSRRWQCAIALIATAVIPLQLVARTPAETPRQESKPDARPVERAKAEQQKPQERVNDARRRVQRAQAAQPSRPVERAPRVQQPRAEQDAGVLDQQSENNKRMLEHIPLVYANALRNHADHSERQLKARIALLEQLRRHTLTTQHETLAQQYRQLAEHYERLAAEQRKLAEELERSQREAAPAK